MNIFVYTFIFISFVQAVFFTWAFLNKSDKVTDLAYGGTFVIVVLGLLFFKQNFFPIQTLITTVVVLWGIRIAGYLFFRIQKIGRDKRFDGIREKLWPFAQFWILQTIAIWVLLLPVMIVLNSNSNIELGTWTIIGVLVWLIGFVFETLADYQKFVFKNNSSNKEKFISTGVWSLSRHPNYFGEILMWWGVFIGSLPYLSMNPLYLLSIASPLFITYILLFVTGIPPLEKSYSKRYKDNKSYQAYKKNTPILIPFVNI